MAQPDVNARSGPPEVSVDLILAARRGDPAAFARVIEHWNPHLRTFVHHTLGDHIFEWFLRNKRAEWADYKAQVTPFELARYLPVW